MIHCVLVSYAGFASQAKEARPLRNSWVHGPGQITGQSGQFPAVGKPRICSSFWDFHNLLNRDSQIEQHVIRKRSAYKHEADRGGAVLMARNRQCAAIEKIHNAGIAQ
jgi:hypothetical protein